MARIRLIGVVVMEMNLHMTIEYPAQIATLSAPYESRLFKRLCSYALLLLLLASTPLFAESICYGISSNGKIDDAAQLPSSGANFSAYSDAGIALGRTYVHTQVLGIIVAAYRELEQTLPETKFVYGETGWKNGGSFKPHRTHQNGLSVDFFVPVRDATGRSVALPTTITNKFGYDIEFDSRAKFRDYVIDFDAIGEHLYALDIAAKKHKAPIKLVIFEPAYLPKLFATKRGDYLKSNVKFMRTQAWVRHDEHYHVDFLIGCKPISAVQTKK
jgi:penicillin-insensitive murein DD-endopeptidase